MGKKVVKSKGYRTLKEVYPVLKSFSPIRQLSEAIGMTPQGLRQRCFAAQFFTEKEKAQAVRAVEDLMHILEGVRSAIEEMPTRI